MTKSPLIGVCGPIGAGKSTVVHALAQALGFHAWPERVEDNPFFTRYVRDPGPWALRSQAAFMLGAVEDAATARTCRPGGVLERPVQEMLGVFARDLHDAGLLDKDELALLTRIGTLGEAVAGVPRVLVLLYAEPACLLKRIRARARTGEEAYELSDLERLDAAYARWIGAWDCSPVVAVDTALHDLRLPAEVERLAETVRAALHADSAGQRRNRTAVHSRYGPKRTDHHSSGQRKLS